MPEPVLNDWVIDMQGGFLYGLAVLSNIVEPDFVAASVSLTHHYWSVVLVDFASDTPQRLTRLHVDGVVSCWCCTRDLDRYSESLQE